MGLLLSSTVGMGRSPDRTSPGGRRAPLLPAPPPGTEPSSTAADLLLHSWPGRLFIVSALLKAVVAVIRRVVEPPAVVEVLSSAATIGLAISLGYFVWRLFVLMKRRLLWRVRRKLILSYIFIGVVPALLIVGFVLVSANVVSMNVAAYLFKDGYDGIVSDVDLAARTAATQIAEGPAAPAEVLTRTAAAIRQRYPGVAMAFVPAKGVVMPPAAAGRWEHQSQPSSVPAWLPADGFRGTTAVPGDEPGELQLVIRAVAPVRGQKGAAGAVVADIPVDDPLFDALKESTSVKAVTARFTISKSDNILSPLQVVSGTNDGTSSFSLFRNSVAFLDTIIWNNGQPRGATLSMAYDVGELWNRLARAQSQRVQFAGRQLGQVFLMVLATVAVLFLIIQGVALLMGLALARSITSSIHELFMGTERVRQGDFTHRINVYTKDQLGELAASFNQMTGSIEGLLLTAAEKKRMEEELRIARQIQMSLLPRGPLEVPGLAVTALCVPAREVGGDYYDFFHLANERIGLLIADVAGKGTSAALYMAELKGLVLALSQTHESPRRLLMEVNRIISENLDSRSFITMTYAVIDRKLGVMTYCRAGHTPLIFLPGPASLAEKGVQILIPDGMVVGLRIPGASEKFDELLEEHRIDLTVGDVVVLYTDGITEAMNTESDLFGETRLSRIVEEHGHLESAELRERILREIEAFVGSADQHDDMTMILLKVEEAFAPVLA
jgi:sigma-B regulation protein RsbU (phosphoserine phosphatase)